MTKWLEDSLAFYASYHHNFKNKLVHIICVWPILFTLQIFLLNAPIPPSIIVSLFPVDFPVNWSLIFALCYGIYYFFVEQPGIAGPLASGLVFGGYFATKHLNETFPEVWKIALLIHIFCWAAQIYAHQVYEKRAPAFLDNIVQALVMAPLFVLLEVLFMIGYKPELQKSVDSIATKNIREFRNSQQKTK